MLKKISIDELQIGMCLVDSGLSFIDYPYLYTGNMVIHSERQIRKLRREGYLEFFIDTERGFIARRRDHSKKQQDLTADPKSAPEQSAGQRKIPLEAELAVARRLYCKALEFSRAAHQAALADQAPDLADTLEIVSAFLQSIDRTPLALIGVSRLHPGEGYALTHGVNVAILSLAFGRHLGLGVIDLQALGAAALLHDIGKTKIPQTVLSKRDRLTPGEFATVQRHPALGRQLLQECSHLPEQTLNAVLDHHEKHDGSGYPRGLSGDAIAPYARIISLADVYDALSSKRGYRGSLPPNQAMSVIYEMRKSAFYPDYAERFIKYMGLYPVGAFVRLSNGAYGVVVDRNVQRPLAPKVRVVFDQRMRRIMPFTVDLDQEVKSGLSISECLDQQNLDQTRLLA
ncbi:MAG: cyclic di-GMP phosphodiesterase [Desulfovibrionales bacterium]|nr:cyclic di-GMP phosphodiesterase [Desulfovibrionales bacterium]